MLSSFMTNTWVAGTAVAVVAGMVGYFVVMRGATFAAHALPQGAFAGAAGASLVGVAPLLGAGAFALLGAAAIAGLSRRGRQDVATALALVVLLASGALFLALSTSYAPEVFSLLFGQLLGVSTADLPGILAVSAVAAALALVLFRPLLARSVLGDAGLVRGRPAAALEGAFLLLLTLATTASVPVVGAFLMFSLITAPAATARVLVVRPVVGLGLSVVIAVGIVWAAIAAGYLTGWPIGFFVGGLGAASYGSGRLAAWFRSRRLRPTIVPC